MARVGDKEKTGLNTYGKDKIESMGRGVEQWEVEKGRR
jgi:hypothetical protein